MTLKNPFDMTGKTVLVTGGSRGLGRGLVQGFAETGADVAIVSRKLDACETAAREVEALGVRAFPHACHTGRWDEIEPMFEAVWDHFGKVDVVINNTIIVGAFAADVSQYWPDPPDPDNRRRTLGGLRIGLPEDMVSTALYLAADASHYVTGAAIKVDGGGWSLGRAREGAAAVS